MTLPHHRHTLLPAVITRLWRWIKRLPARARCLVSGHWWAPYDLVSDRCLCCDTRRTLRIKRELP